MIKELDLMDPTADFCKSVQKNALVSGKTIADKHFTDDMAEAMGVVFGEMLANAVVGSVGASLFDVPMERMADES